MSSKRCVSARCTKPERRGPAAVSSVKIPSGRKHQESQTLITRAQLIEQQRSIEQLELMADVVIDILKSAHVCEGQDDILDFLQGHQQHYQQQLQLENHPAHELSRAPLFRPLFLDEKLADEKASETTSDVASDVDYRSCVLHRSGDSIDWEEIDELYADVTSASGNETVDVKEYPLSTCPGGTARELTEEKVVYAGIRAEMQVRAEKEALQRTTEKWRDQTPPWAVTESKRAESQPMQTVVESRRAETQPLQSASPERQRPPLLPVPRALGGRLSSATIPARGPSSPCANRQASPRGSSVQAVRTSGNNSVRHSLSHGSRATSGRQSIPRCVASPRALPLPPASTEGRPERGVATSSPQISRQSHRHTLAADGLSDLCMPRTAAGRSRTPRVSQDAQSRPRASSPVACRRTDGPGKQFAAGRKLHNLTPPQSSRSSTFPATGVPAL